jgi:hypothetical protein
LNPLRHPLARDHPGGRRPSGGPRDWAAGTKGPGRPLWSGRESPLRGRRNRYARSWAGSGRGARDHCADFGARQRAEVEHAARQREGRPRTSCWCGMAAVRARIRGRLGAAPQPAAPSNGTGGRALLTGDLTVSPAGGAPMVGRQCRLTGSGFLGVQSSITPSRTGEAQRAGGVIRSR